MKEKDNGREPNLKEKTLELWQTLEEAEDLYLKDFPTKTPLVFSFGKVKVSINFACYKDCREYGIGAISISRQEANYGEFRKDMIIRRKSASSVESAVKEYDLDASTNHLPGDKNYPFIMPDLSQPINYYEEVLDNAKNPDATYRKIQDEDIDEANGYLERITSLLTHIDLLEHGKNQ